MKEKQQVIFWKERDPYLCNLKACLMFLVILGHLLECRLENGAIRLIYQGIYSVHMPLFVYVTGMGARTAERCRKQFEGTLRLYLEMQILCLVCQYLISGREGSLLVPYWHLWFLLSMIWWSLLGWLCLLGKKKGIPSGFLFGIGTAASCISGLCPEINRFLSLSRTVVFFPYYLLGMWNMGRRLPEKKVWCSLALLPSGLGLLYIVFQLPYGFIYQAEGFGSSFAAGMMGRVVCMLTAVSMGIVILGWTPRRKVFWTKLGIDTLPVYLAHVIFVPFAAFFYDLFGQTLGFIVSIMYAFTIMVGIYGLTRFRRPLFRLTTDSLRSVSLANGKDRRGSPLPPEPVVKTEKGILVGK